MAGLNKISYPTYQISIYQIFRAKNILPLSYPILPYLTQLWVTWVSNGKKKTASQLIDFQLLGNLGKIFAAFVTYKKNKLT